MRTFVCLVALLACAEIAHALPGMGNTMAAAAPPMATAAMRTKAPAMATVIAPPAMGMNTLKTMGGSNVDALCAPYKTACKAFPAGATLLTSTAISTSLAEIGRVAAGLAALPSDAAAACQQYVDCIEPEQCGVELALCLRDTTCKASFTAAVLSYDPEADGMGMGPVSFTDAEALKYLTLLITNSEFRDDFSVAISSSNNASSSLLFCVTPPTPTPTPTPYELAGAIEQDGPLTYGTQLNYAGPGLSALGCIEVSYPSTQGYLVVNNIGSRVCFGWGVDCAANQFVLDFSGSRASASANGLDICNGEHRVLAVTTNFNEACLTTCRPQGIVFRYTPGNCAGSMNQQGPQATCAMKPSGASLSGTASLSSSDGKLSVSSVAPGSTFTLSADGNTDVLKVASTIKLTTGASSQTVSIATSCAQPLAAGDVYGSLTVVSFVYDINACSVPTATGKGMAMGMAMGAASSFTGNVVVNFYSDGAVVGSTIVPLNGDVSTLGPQTCDAGTTTLGLGTNMNSAYSGVSLFVGALTSSQVASLSSSLPCEAGTATGRLTLNGVTTSDLTTSARAAIACGIAFQLGIDCSVYPSAVTLTGVESSGSSVVVAYSIQLPSSLSPTAAADALGDLATLEVSINNWFLIASLPLTTTVASNDITSLISDAATPSPSVTVSATSAPSASRSASLSIGASPSRPPSPSSAASASASSTSAASASATSAASASTSVGASASSTSAASASATSAASASSSVGASASSTSAASASATSAASASSSVGASVSSSSSASVSATVSASVSVSASASATVSETGSASASVSGSPSVSVTATVSSSPTPSPLARVDAAVILRGLTDTQFTSTLQQAFIDAVASEASVPSSAVTITSFQNSAVPARKADPAEVYLKIFFTITIPFGTTYLGTYEAALANAADSIGQNGAMQDAITSAFASTGSSIVVWYFAQSIVTVDGSGSENTEL